MKWYVISNDMRIVIGGPHVKTAKQAAVEAVLSGLEEGTRLSRIICVSQKGFELNDHEENEDEFFDTEYILKAAGFNIEDEEDTDENN